MTNDFKYIFYMENLFDEILSAQSALERSIENYKRLQPKVRELERNREILEMLGEE